MLKGDLETGFIGFEARWQLAGYHPHFPELPIWKGADLSGQVLLVYAEQGIGDSLQFCRYLPLLRGKAETIIFYCDPSLVRLLGASPIAEGIEIWGWDKPLPDDIDAVIPMMSLPRIAHTKIETIPNEVPYLAPPTSDVPVIASPATGLRVGLCWAGAYKHRNDHNRSMKIEQFAQILDLPNIQFYSLQMGERQKDIEESCFDPMIRDLSSHIRDFADTASLMRNLDLVITVDTSIAHLAGAMNIPVWTMLPFAPDWRWQMVRGDSIWYPSMNLIRQTSSGDWQEVMHRVRDRLIHLLHERRK